MGRKFKPLENSLRWEIYQAYLSYASGEFRDESDDNHRGPTMPNPHTFWQNVLPRMGYPMAWGTFQREWDRLKHEGLILVDKRTNAIMIPNHVLIGRDEV